MLTAVDSQMTTTAADIEALGKRHNRRFRFIMQAGKLVEPLYWYQDEGPDYYLIPREKDTSEIPAEADRAAGLVMAAGYKVVGQIIAHEVKDFEPYRPKRKQAEEIEVVPVDVEAQIEAVEETLSNIGQALVTGAKVTGKAMKTAITTTLGVFTLLLIDPALIVIIEQEDGTHIWVEVSNWMEV